MIRRLRRSNYTGEKLKKTWKKVLLLGNYVCLSHKNCTCLEIYKTVVVIGWVKIPTGQRSPQTQTSAWGRRQWKKRFFLTVTFLKKKSMSKKVT